jgi:hypothetical protein
VRQPEFIVWDRTTGRVVAHPSVPSELTMIRSVTFSPDNSRVVVTGTTTAVLDATTWRSLEVVNGGFAGAWLSPDASHDLVTAGEFLPDGHLALWDAKGSVRGYATLPPREVACCMSAPVRSNRMVLGLRSGRLWLRDIGPGLFNEGPP